MLLEAIIALLTVSLSLLLFQSLTRVLASHLQSLQSSSQMDWLVFSRQLQAELANSQLDGVKNDVLYVTQGNKQLAYGISNGDDFRKTNRDGRGYQPMLFDLEEAHITQMKQQIKIHFFFKDGLKRELLYEFEN